jgi:2-iminoacetate synthase
MKTESKNSYFANILNAWQEARLRELIAQATPAGVTRALSRESLYPEDLAALLSPAAAPRLEDMAHRAQRITRRQFGRTIGLFIPLYLSNICRSDCTYCGYAAGSGQKGDRRILKPAEIRAECETLARKGFQNLLLLTGEAPRVSSVNYLVEAIAIAREYFPSISVEVYAMDQDDYRKLVQAGLEGVTLFMETYHRPTYSQVHLGGRKQDFDYRLGALERAGHAGVRRLGLGALLGLYDWRLDGFWMALHARYLQKECWQSAVSLSFPRLRDVPARHTGK